MADPLILAVEDDPDAREAIERELLDRYARSWSRPRRRAAGARASPATTGRPGARERARRPGRAAPRRARPATCSAPRGVLGPLIAETGGDASPWAGLYCSTRRGTTRSPADGAVISPRACRRPAGRRRRGR